MNRSKAVTAITPVLTKDVSFSEKVESVDSALKSRAAVQREIKLKWAAVIQVFNKYEVALRIAVSLGKAHIIKIDDCRFCVVSNSPCTFWLSSSNSGLRISSKTAFAATRSPCWTAIKATWPSNGANTCCC